MSHVPARAAKRVAIIPRPFFFSLMTAFYIERKKNQTELEKCYESGFRGWGIGKNTKEQRDIQRGIFLMILFCLYAVGATRRVARIRWRHSFRATQRVAPTREKFGTP